MVDRRWTPDKMLELVFKLSQEIGIVAVFVIRQTQLLDGLHEGFCCEYTAVRTKMPFGIGEVIGFQDRISRSDRATPATICQVHQATGRFDFTSVTGKTAVKAAGNPSICTSSLAGVSGAWRASLGGQDATDFAQRRQSALQLASVANLHGKRHIGHGGFAVRIDPDNVEPQPGEHLGQIPKQAGTILRLNIQINRVEGLRLMLAPSHVNHAFRLTNFQRQKARAVRTMNRYAPAPCHKT